MRIEETALVKEHALLAFYVKLHWAKNQVPLLPLPPPL